MRVATLILAFDRTIGFETLSMNNERAMIRTSFAAQLRAAGLANERASEPTRAERGLRAPASERVLESEGRSPSQ
jgi:hypothetical protein